jgi:carbonic anhydrase
VKKELEGMDFLPISDLKEAVSKDVAFLKGNKLILKEVEISGWVMDIDTGKLSSVVE